MKAVNLVLTVEEFKIPSEPARQAVETAEKLVKWVSVNESNKKLCNDFFNGLVVKFKKCFKQRKSMKVREEIMWKEYHKVRSSDSFKQGWVLFMKNSIDRPALPTFFQYVSHRIFRELVKGKHQIVESEEDQASSITKLDQNALRYVAGFICRKVQAKIKSSSLPRKDDMILFICDFSGDEWDEAQGTEEWTNAVDRGGLWHINDDTYSIFFLMEEEIRNHLKVSKAKALNKETKKKLLDAILTNEDLLFQWSLISARVDDDVGSAVLQKIVELYVTIRGFFCFLLPRTLQAATQEENTKI